MKFIYYFIILLHLWWKRYDFYLEHMIYMTSTKPHDQIQDGDDRHLEFLGVAAISQSLS